jgi:acyl-coenzyme A thioesterase PaaI-like protein
MASQTLALYERMRRWPAGQWLFTRAICFKAPYFGSISPRIETLEPGRCVASIRRHRAITNHIGSVHAIAMCNLAELVGGMVTEVTLPDSMRWIPKGMTVAYLKKAMGTIRAVATPAIPIVHAEEGYDVPVEVVLTDAAGDAVFRATITMWLSPRPPASATR